MLSRWSWLEAIKGVRVEDGLRIMLNKTYHLTRETADRWNWLELRMLMGEEPAEVVRWQAEENVEDRARLRVMFHEMRMRQKDELRR